jgi:uncharacterized YigZ family protein
VNDSYITIAAPSQGVYRAKGSRFLASACPVRSEAEIKQYLDGLRKKYFDARHHCYAYRLGNDGEQYRASDDGEPSHTAGKPILGQLVANRLTNTLVAVTRYFGGVLLGTGGLIQAYRLAAADALANAEIITVAITDTFMLAFDYHDINRILKIAKEMNLHCSNQCFNMRCTLHVSVSRHLSEQFIKRLQPVESLKIERVATA